MSTYLAQKPHLNEIFAAFSGIGHAAMGVPLSSPIGVLEKSSSDLRYKLRQGLVDPDLSIHPLDYQNKAARRALRFLKESLPLLKEYETLPLVNSGMQKTGGTLGDVAMHICSLLDREAKDEGRPIVTFREDGLRPHFAATYIPSGYTAADPGYAYTETGEDIDPEEVLIVEETAEDTVEDILDEKILTVVENSFAPSMTPAKDEPDDGIAIPTPPGVRIPALHA
jgi:hypothetical protein